MTIVGFAAIGLIKYEYIKPGDPMRLIHAIDYDGRICGYDSDVKNKPIGYYMATSSGKNTSPIIKIDSNLP